MNVEDMNNDVRDSDDLVILLFFFLTRKHYRGGNEFHITKSVVRDYGMNAAQCRLSWTFVGRHTII